MARCMVALLLLVSVAAQDMSSSSCPQAGHSLMQTKSNMVAAEHDGIVPNPKLQTAQVLVKERKLGGFVSLASKPPLSKGGFCRSHPCSMLAAGDKRRGLGVTADMDEEGYKAVAKLKDDLEMKTFILRFAEDFDCRIKDEGGLMGIVPWFSGTTAVQSLATLEESLLFAVLANGERWISYKNSAGTTGTDAPLDLQGYMEVAIIRKDIEMQAFARRLAENMSIQVTDEGGFAGMIKYHSGAAAFQSFDKLQKEIESAASSPHAWAKHKTAPHPTLEAAQVSVKERKLGGFVSLASRLPLSKGGFCRSHPCSMLAAGDKRRGLGVTADMDEEGYKAVAKLKDDKEMKTFILRLIEDYDCRVKDEGGLMGIVPWFSGTTAAQSLAKLEESLLFAVLANGERWMSYKNSAGTTGTDAPLDLQGYMEVAISRKDIEMQAFARRLAENMGIQVTDEGGFAGMIKYHSGTAAFQSFDKLQKEIKSAAASPHAWATHKSM